MFRLTPHQDLPYIEFQRNVGKPAHCCQGKRNGMKFGDGDIKRYVESKEYRREIADNDKRTSRRLAKWPRARHTVQEKSRHDTSAMCGCQGGKSHDRGVCWGLAEHTLNRHAAVKTLRAKQPSAGGKWLSGSWRCTQCRYLADNVNAPTASPHRHVRPWLPFSAGNRCRRPSSSRLDQWSSSSLVAMYYFTKPGRGGLHTNNVTQEWWSCSLRRRSSADMACQERSPDTRTNSNTMM